MAYTDEYTLSQDATFKGRVQIALLRSAIAILQQPKADSGQLAASRRVVDNPEAFVAPATAVIVTSGKLSAVAPDASKIPDSDLQGAVDAALLLLVR